MRIRKKVKGAFAQRRTIKCQRTIKAVLSYKKHEKDGFFRGHWDEDKSDDLLCTYIPYSLYIQTDIFLNNQFYGTESTNQRGFFLQYTFTLSPNYTLP